MTPHQRLHVFLGDRSGVFQLAVDGEIRLLAYEGAGEKSGRSHVGSRLSLKSNR
jgi:hypothetical protein